MISQSWCFMLFLGLLCINWGGVLERAVTVSTLGELEDVHQGVFV